MPRGRPVTVYVKDHDEAVRLYTGTLGLEKCTDIRRPAGSAGRRSPKGQTEMQNVLELSRDPDRGPGY